MLIGGMLQAADQVRIINGIGSPLNVWLYYKSLLGSSEETFQNHMLYRGDNKTVSFPQKLGKTRMIAAQDTDKHFAPVEIGIGAMSGKKANDIRFIIENGKLVGQKSI